MGKAVDNLKKADLASTQQIFFQTLGVSATVSSCEIKDYSVLAGQDCAQDVI